MNNFNLLLEENDKMGFMNDTARLDWSRTDFAGMTFDQRRRVADQIAATRKERGITQEDLARLAGIPARTISGMENGSTPQAGTLRKLADALAATPAGAPVDTAAAQIFADVTTPMYLQLSGPGRAEALREIVLLLAAALDREQAEEPKEQTEQQH